MQFQDADQMVSLPKVSRQSTSSQLFLRTDASGNNLIHLEGAVDNYGKPTGFLLVQEHDGNVTLIEGQLKWSMTSADPGYAEVMRVAEGYLQEYVNGLSALESSEKPSGDNLYSIRKRLGEKSVKQARKQVKESLDTSVPVQPMNVHNVSKTTIKMKPNPDTGEAECVSVVRNDYQVVVRSGQKISILSGIK